MSTKPTKYHDYPIPMFIKVNWPITSICQKGEGGVCVCNNPPFQKKIIGRSYFDDMKKFEEKKIHTKT